MISSIFAHVVLKPHVHPEDILGVGVLCIAAAVVLMAMTWRHRQ
jgi:hypothetical protein